MSFVTVEIGHTYAPERLVPLARNGGGDFNGHGLSFTDTPEAKRLRNFADCFGPAVRVALFDDVVANQEQANSTDEWRRSMFMGISQISIALGTGAERVYRESQFESAGRTIVDEIQDMSLPKGYRLSKDGSKLKLPKGMIPNTKTISLTGFAGVEDQTHPSCEVMDTAWLQERLTIAPEAITILPSELEGQQARASILADLVGIPSSVYSTVLYDR